MANSYKQHQMRQQHQYITLFSSMPINKKNVNTFYIAKLMNTHVNGSIKTVKKSRVINITYVNDKELPKLV